jgi:hypothetical protein
MDLNMPVIDDIYEIVDNQTDGTRLIQNRYHYQLKDLGTANASDSAEILTRAFAADMLPSIRDTQVDVINHENLDAKNLNSLAEDWTQLLTGETGNQVGEIITPLVAFSFQLFPFFKSIKWGRKSISGVSEGIVDGDVVGGAFLPNLATLAGAFATNIVDPVTGARFAPLIARILPSNVRPFVPFAVGVASALYKGLGTQYSRKRGRGA